MLSPNNLLAQSILIRLHTLIPSHKVLAVRTTSSMSSSMVSAFISSSGVAFAPLPAYEHHTLQRFKTSFENESQLRVPARLTHDLEREDSGQLLQDPVSAFRFRLDAKIQNHKRSPADVIRNHQTESRRKCRGGVDSDVLEHRMRRVWTPE